MEEVRSIETPYGLARATVSRPASARRGGGEARGLLVLGHGAGGGIGAPDLQAATATALAAGLTVALVEQPYRVAGRRSAAPAPRLDLAWEVVVSELARASDLVPRATPLICGGRSSGARVACRTAGSLGAAAVLCLAFPLLAPAQRGSGERFSRLPELEAVPNGVPVLIVQGVSDRFGTPLSTPERTVVTVRGDHGLKSDLGALREAIAIWLAALVNSPSG